MMRKLATWFVAVPLAAIIVVFAVANRRWISVSLDPFGSDPPVFDVTLPLFVIILIALIVGVIVGGIATWFGQAQWRRAARRHRRDLHQAHTELGALRRRLEGGEGHSTSLTPLSRRPPAA